MSSLLRLAPSLLAFGVALSAACIHPSRECEPPSSFQCTSAATFNECISTENGGTTLFKRPCQDQWSCDPALVQRRKGCVGRKEGESCETDAVCEPEMRCEAGACTAGLPADRERCEKAPTFKLPDDESAVTIEIDLSSDVGLVERVIRPLCPGDASRGRLGVVQLEGTFTDQTALLVEYPDRTIRTAVRTIGSITCSTPYARRPLAAQCERRAEAAPEFENGP